MTPLEAQLRQRLDQREQQHLYRRRLTTNSAQGARIDVAGRSLLNFCSNDYLGLANHPALIAAGQRALNEFGAGSGASHLICGHSSYHERLEQKLAEITGRDRAILFSTGYMANLGVISALLSRGDQLLQDRLNHASLLDGGVLSGARFQRFAHNDVDDLQRRLKQLKPEGQRMIAVDAVFSMDGDLAPLKALAQVAKDHNAWLMADDAHGFGVMGDKGEGHGASLTQDELPILMCTLGKALGSFGAFIAGSETLIESLIQFARPYIYTTALPPAVAATSLAAIELLESERWRREHLQSLIAQFKAGLDSLNLELMPSTTAIQPILVGDSDAAMAMSKALEQRGILATAIRPPTVPEGSARLRITLSAAHSEEDVNTLLNALAECA